MTGGVQNRNASLQQRLLQQQQQQGLAAKSSYNPSYQLLQQRGKLS